MIRRFVIFGATGDLTARMLLPALAQLQAGDHLPDGLEVIGVAPEHLDAEGFRERAAASLATYAGQLPAAVRDRTVGALTYRTADVTDPGSLRSALGAADEPYLAYLALPPAVFLPAVRGLESWGTPPGSRIVVEKPFGEDLASTRELNTVLRSCFEDDAVFRVDHFLGLQTVRNLLAVRFANRVFESLWSAQHVESVGINWDETLTLEGRAGYYDRAGALRDMVQSHLLQLLALVAMEPPATLSPRDLRDRKAEALRAVRRLDHDDVAALTRRARYTSGRIGDRTVPSYVDEPGVDAGRGTESFCEVTLYVDTWRWAGVPFILRTGKALSADRREIAVRFRPVPHLVFDTADPPEVNELRFSIEPDRLSLRVEVHAAGAPSTFEATELACTLAPQELTPHAFLLLAALRGDPLLAIRGDEAEESWRIVEPILAAWGAGAADMQEYPAGSSGPGPTFTRHWE